MTDNRDESLIDKVKNAFGMGDDHRDHDDDQGSHDHAVGAGAGVGGTFDRDPGDVTNRPAGPDYGASDVGSDVGSVDDTRYGTTETIDVTHASDDYGASDPVDPLDPVERPMTDDLPGEEDRTEGWAGVDDALGGAGERSTYGSNEPADPDRR